MTTESHMSCPRFKIFPSIKTILLNFENNRLRPWTDITHDPLAVCRILNFVQEIWSRSSFMFIMPKLKGYPYFLLINWMAIFYLIITPNLLIFTSWLVNNNTHIKCVTIAMFHLLIFMKIMIWRWIKLCQFYDKYTALL